MLALCFSLDLSSISYYGQHARNLTVILEVIQFLTKWFSTVLMYRFLSILSCLRFPHTSCDVEILRTVNLVPRSWGLNLALDRQCYLNAVFVKHDRPIPASDSLLISLSSNVHPMYFCLGKSYLLFKFVSGASFLQKPSLRWKLTVHES